MNKGQGWVRKEVPACISLFLFLFVSLRVSGLKTMVKVHLNDFALETRI